MTAAIYVHTSGYELRIYSGDDEHNVLHSSVSTEGDAPLITRAHTLRTLILSQPPGTDIDNRSSHRD